MFRGRQMVRTARQVRSDGPPPSRDEVIAAQEQSVKEPQTAERISFASAVRPVDGDNTVPDAVPTSAPDQDAAAKPEPAIEPAPVAPGVEGVHVPTSIELAAAADLYAKLVSVTESIFEVAVELLSEVVDLEGQGHQGDRRHKGRERILRVTTNTPIPRRRGEEDTLVEESTIIMDPGAIARGQCESALETILREGGRRLLQEALELEVQQYIERFQQLKSESGQGLVVRNGYHQERELVTGAGKVPVRQPRVHDRRPTERFTSAILPPYLRRTPSIDALIPALYLKGVSTSAFPEALQAILGDGVVGLSANNVVRLKQVWEQEFQAWSKRDLHGKRYVYLWADAVYFNVRLQKDRPCVLVVVGATEDGHKELLAIQDGERESHLSWLHLLQDLKARGLKEHSFLAVADGALGFWKALEEALPGARAQQCWVHKTANVLDKLSQRVRPDAKSLLHEMYLAPAREDALAAYDRFLGRYQDKYPKACECLRKDRDVMFAFYDFPAAHWVHLRTTNPIESTFATVRHRTRQTKACGSRVTALTMVFKLATQAERHWRRLNSYQLITHLVDGDTFTDGELQLKKAA